MALFLVRHCMGLAYFLVLSVANIYKVTSFYSIVWFLLKTIEGMRLKRAGSLNYQKFVSISMFGMLCQSEEGMVLLTITKLFVLWRTSALQYEQVNGAQPCHAPFYQAIHANLRKIFLSSTIKMFGMLLNYILFECSDISVLMASFGTYFYYSVIHCVCMRLL